ncbi:unnamed protein product [Heterobilharzia americana]|nr:unnamed protein product [Heterobilharzia americana]
MKVKLQDDALKDPLVCAVESYISENSSESLTVTPNKNDQLKQIWDSTILTAFDEVCCLLSDIFIMSDKQPHLIAKCFFCMGQLLYLKGLLHIPDLNDNWNPENNDIIAFTNNFTQELTQKNFEEVNLHSGFRWRNRNDVINDLRLYNSVQDLFSQATSLFIIALKMCFTQNFMGLASQVTESLLNLLGGCHESVSILTQDLLIGFQSCSTAVKLRTHLWLTLLACDARKCAGGTQSSFDIGSEFADRSVLSSSEALIRQLLWSVPSCVFDDICLFNMWGFCSSVEPSSYPEALAWIAGLKYNVISNRLRSTGGLCNGSEDHSVSASPWISSILRTLTSQSQAWRITEVNPSIAFDSTKAIQSALSTLPGSSLQTAKNWNFLIMEHSIDSCFLYVAVPKRMNRMSSTQNHRSSVSTNKSQNKGSCQYTFQRLETDPVTRCKLVYSWKICLNQLDEQLKKAANIKINSKNLFKEITNQILMMKSHLFKNSTENILLFNYLNPIFEMLSKHWSPEVNSNQCQNKRSSNSINNSDQEEIISQIKLVDQLSSCFEQYLSNPLNLPTDGLVIISDFWLNELPLESLLMNTLLIELDRSDCLSYRRQSSFIQRSHITATLNSIKQSNSPVSKQVGTVLPFSWLTREFSVQLLYSRLTGHQKNDEQSSDNLEQGSQHKTSRKVDVTRGVSRHPLLRDIGTKLPPLQFSKQQNSGCLLVSTTSVRYLVDPFLDTEIPSADSTINTFGRINGNKNTESNGDLGIKVEKSVNINSLNDHFQLLLNKPISRSQQFTSRWIGLIGDRESGEVPSKEELVVFLSEGASGLFSYTTESFLSYLPPAVLVNLSIPNCHFICLLDKVYTRTSRLRQIRINAHKTLVEQELEQPLTMSVISTLTGLRSTVVLQWSTRLHINQFRLEKLMKYLLDQVSSIGQSTLLIQCELFKKELDDYKNYLKQIDGVKDIQLSEGKKSSGQLGHPQEKNKSMQMKVMPTLEPFNMIIYGLPNISFA